MQCLLSTTICSILRVEEDGIEFVDGVGLFKTEMYVSRMHSRYSRGKILLFKRYLFLKNISNQKVAKRLVVAVED
jgi:hypothetical protein